MEACPRIYFKTKKGKLFVGDSLLILRHKKFLRKYGGKVSLIFTSPPFILNQKKKYGNLNGEEYIKWISDYGKVLQQYLKRDGSLVVELGNAWDKGHPTQSTLPMVALLAMCKAGNLKLCQELTYFNPAKLPTPAEWVTIRRIRLKDSTTKIWWMAKNAYPYANNKNVLVPYSSSMEKLLKTKRYNSGRRPSDHIISKKSFLKNNKGAIASNLITASNTMSSTKYLQFCKKKGIPPHPARMPEKIPEFFINFLTKKGDLVLDPFAGSNTTGKAAEKYARRWISIEANKVYARGSKARF